MPSFDLSGAYSHLAYYRKLNIFTSGNLASTHNIRHAYGIPYNLELTSTCKFCHNLQKKVIITIPILPELNSSAPSTLSSLSSEMAIGAVTGCGSFARALKKLS